MKSTQMKYEKVLLFVGLKGNSKTHSARFIGGIQTLKAQVSFHQFLVFGTRFTSSQKTERVAIASQNVSNVFTSKKQRFCVYFVWELS